MPYLIGSKEWHEKWHIGLVEEETDDSDNENLDQESLLSSPDHVSSSNVPESLSESENLTEAITSKKSGEIHKNVSINHLYLIIKTYFVPL